MQDQENLEPMCLRKEVWIDQFENCAYCSQGCDSNHDPFNPPDTTLRVTRGNHHTCHDQYQETSYQNHRQADLHQSTQQHGKGIKLVNCRRPCYR